MTSSKLICTSLFLAVVAAASPMLLKLNDLSHSVWGNALPLFWTRNRNFNICLLVTGSLLFAYLILKVWKFLFHPLEMQRKLHDIGYFSDEKRPLKDVANEYRKRRKRGDVPPVYPNGWFHVLASNELAMGEVKYVSILGEDLVVFRGTDGIAYIVNAYCPHLGANLGIGGQVVGDCLQCPFHGWKFRGSDGKCTDIPYSENIPNFAQTKAWNCWETNHTIYIWYHAEGSEPSWYPDEIEEIQNGTWTYRGFTQHTINAHIEEIPENGADLNHLDHLHSSPVLSGVDLRHIFSHWWQFARHNWSAEWKPLEDTKHVGCLQLVTSLSVFGYKIPYLDLHVAARQTGPGLVFMKWSSSFGDGIFLHSVTPKEPLLQIMRHSIYVSRGVPTIVAKFLLYAEAIQVERDIMIWNHKTYVPKPLLVKEDHLIKKHRRWYSQFYSENSPRLSMKKENLDW